MTYNEPTRRDFLVMGLATTTSIVSPVYAQAEGWGTVKDLFLKANHFLRMVDTVVRAWNGVITFKDYVLKILGYGDSPTSKRKAIEALGLEVSQLKKLFERHGKFSDTQIRNIVTNLKNGNFVNIERMYNLGGSPVIFGRKPGKSVSGCAAVGVRKSPKAPAMIEAGGIISLWQAQADVIGKLQDEFSPEERKLTKSLTMPKRTVSQMQLGDIYRGYGRPIVYESERGIVQLDWKRRKKNGLIQGVGTYQIHDRIAGKTYEKSTPVFSFPGV